MELESFRKSKSLTYAELANKLDLKKTTTYAICTKKVEISLRNAYQILKATGGAVTYDDLLN